MKKFEYDFRTIDHDCKNWAKIVLLNELGEEGWELCGSYYEYFIFKREVE